MPSSLRPPLLSVLGLALLLGSASALTGCDSSSTGGPTFVDAGIRTSTFTPRFNDFAVNATGDIASFERQTTQLTRSVVDDGVVLLYARGDLVIDGGANTWVALPYTQGIEGSADGVPFVDYTISYAYSFGVNTLYLDVISSAQILDTREGEFFIPDGIPFRLVTIPGDVARASAVDLSDYEAVKRAFGLNG